MLVKKMELRTVNATAYIYDDYCIPATKDNKEALEKRCTEIMLPALLRDAKSTA